MKAEEALDAEVITLAKRASHLELIEVLVKGGVDHLVAALLEFFAMAHKGIPGDEIGPHLQVHALQVARETVYYLALETAQVERKNAARHRGVNIADGVGIGRCRHRGEKLFPRSDEGCVHKLGRLELAEGRRIAEVDILH